VLIFYCTYCSETITGGDYESPDQILDRVEEHVTKCPLARFTFEGTTDVARQRVETLGSVTGHERLAGKIRSH
jgi:hypothetical protein